MGSHVQLCKTSYLECISPCMAKIWKHFKQYTLNLATAQPYCREEQLVQRCFLRLLKRQQVFHENIEVLSKVYDEDTRQEFERARTNAVWKQDCEDKYDMLCKDICAMHNLLKIDPPSCGQYKQYKTC